MRRWTGRDELLQPVHSWPLWKLFEIGLLASFNREVGASNGARREGLRPSDRHTTTGESDGNRTNEHAHPHDDGGPNLSNDDAHDHGSNQCQYKIKSHGYPATPLPPARYRKRDPLRAWEKEKNLVATVGGLESLHAYRWQRILPVHHQPGAIPPRTKHFRGRRKASSVDRGRSIRIHVRLANIRFHTTSSDVHSPFSPPLSKNCSPATQAISPTRSKIRGQLTGSLRNIIPTIAVPAAPMPVQTA